ncbi:esterase [Dyella terrae]|uniref:Esterase n=3 Tax=Rhodanobacteraceae TaxID=1775411 RepID=A0A4R0YWG0_9GAMM|nr:esterase [Dyella terrae]TCI13742.1 esterase [Dyella soli]
MRFAFLLLLTLMTFNATADDARFLERDVTVQGETLHYRVFVPDGWTSKRTWPVVLFLHGSGERGSDNAKTLSQGLPPWLRTHGKDFPAVVVIPQVASGAYWSGKYEEAAIKALEASIDEFHGDRQRLYLTGLSMGGFGSWQIAKDHPDLFAAAVIICGGIEHPPRLESPSHVDGVPDGVDPYAWVASNIGTLPVWLFHGSDDPVVSVEGSRGMHHALEARKKEVRYTEYPGMGHGVWENAYATPGLWPWVFGHVKAQ